MPTPDHCAECAFTYDLTTAPAAAAAITVACAEAATLIVRHATSAPTRTAPDTWSALEYGCHLRDVLLVQRERVLLALRVEQPAPEPMGREERVVLDGYAEQFATDVARQLTDASALFVHVLDRLDDSQWDRTMIYNYPTPAPRSLRWVAVHTEHEARHHLADIRRQLPDA
jgi:DinB superfamily